MIVDGKQTRPIWLDADQKTVKVIDQRQLPHRFVVADLTSVDAVIHAIREMFVRGAPLIGVTGAYGVMIAAMKGDAAGDGPAFIRQECLRLKAARPTAVNLAWGVDRVLEKVMAAGTAADRIDVARNEAAAIAEEEAENCRRLGVHGADLITSVSREKNGATVNILTHCNAGWLACIEYGTATAPIYEAFNRGVDLHVWVDETRPLNQGARLTAWELGKHGVPHTVITDNAGGHLMQHGRVDMVIVGTDRSTHTGDVANKIGTYLKALAARDNGIPFYVALPSSTFDWTMTDGVKEIPIEERNPDEVRYIQGLADGRITRVLVPPESSPAADFAFDVTPARLVTGFVTERGVCGASEAEIHGLFPEF
ncbi:methylthioribose-1-phosphate isomerase [Desulfosarcina alkanivorans]|uniref:Methylthioribose-1-phosphate isomerase n=1 Tax=Desulfosarcina alkanivorans TaxID=571177 RepID=A0A5K7YI70_9BACT|nr:S-methyl-5-thioribose-1-phosphate isomerase [Desulfosarcina alkanivorans]BBO68253.1 methylthioribose-1-phosphate isomerase [Desulfosarcina alkanivorans]